MLGGWLSRHSAVQVPVCRSETLFPDWVWQRFWTMSVTARHIICIVHKVCAISHTRDSLVSRADDRDSSLARGISVPPREEVSIDMRGRRAVLPLAVTRLTALALDGSVECGRISVSPS